MDVDYQSCFAYLDDVSKWAATTNHVFLCMWLQDKFLLDLDTAQEVVEAWVKGRADRRLTKGSGRR